MKMKFLIILSLICLGIVNCSPLKSSKSDYDLLMDKLMDPKDYNKDLSPNFEEDKAIAVGVTAHLYNYKFDERERKFTTNMYFRQKFVDKRLSDSNRKGKLVGGANFYELIWTPDTFFSSAISVKPFNDPKPNLFVSISADGSVMTSQLLRVTVPCYKKDSGYQCNINMESYGYGANVIEYNFPTGNDSVNLGDGNYENQDFKVGVSAVEDIVELSMGKYSILKVAVNLEKVGEMGPQMG